MKILRIYLLFFVLLLFYNNTEAQKRNHAPDSIVVLTKHFDLDIVYPESKIINLKRRLEYSTLSDSTFVKSLKVILSKPDNGGATVKYNLNYKLSSETLIDTIRNVLLDRIYPTTKALLSAVRKVLVDIETTDGTFIKDLYVDVITPMNGKVFMGLELSGSQLKEEFHRALKTDVLNEESRFEILESIHIDVSDVQDPETIRRVLIKNDKKNGSIAIEIDAEINFDKLLIEKKFQLNRLNLYNNLLKLRHLSYSNVSKGDTTIKKIKFKVNPSGSDVNLNALVDIKFADLDTSRYLNIKQLSEGLELMLSKDITFDDVLDEGDTIIKKTMLDVEDIDKNSIVQTMSDKIHIDGDTVSRFVNLNVLNEESSLIKTRKIVTQVPDENNQTSLKKSTIDVENEGSNINISLSHNSSISLIDTSRFLYVDNITKSTDVINLSQVNFDLNSTNEETQKNVKLKSQTDGNDVDVSIGVDVEDNYNGSFAIKRNAQVDLLESDDKDRNLVIDVGLNLSINYPGNSTFNISPIQLIYKDPDYDADAPNFIFKTPGSTVQLKAQIIDTGKVSSSKVCWEIEKPSIVKFVGTQVVDKDTTYAKVYKDFGETRLGDFVTLEPGTDYGVSSIKVYMLERPDEILRTFNIFVVDGSTGN